MKCLCRSSSHHGKVCGLKPDNTIYDFPLYKWCDREYCKGKFLLVNN